MNELITKLLGERIEMKGRENWYSDFDQGREPIIGIIRLIGVVGGQIVFHVEDDSGWVQSRSTMTHTYRVLD